MHAYATGICETQRAFVLTNPEMFKRINEMGRFALLINAIISECHFCVQREARNISSPVDNATWRTMQLHQRNETLSSSAVNFHRFPSAGLNSLNGVGRRRNCTTRTILTGCRDFTYRRFLDRRSNILAEERDDAPVNGSSRSIGTGESGDQAGVGPTTRNQRTPRR